MTYIIAILAALLLATGLDDWREHHNIQAAALANAAEAGKHTEEISNGAQDESDELTQLRAYRAAHPDDAPVQLCVPDVQAPAPAKAGPRPASPVLQPVHGPDNPVRAVEPPQPGPDISGMLRDLAAGADSILAELRDQQAVD